MTSDDVSSLVHLSAPLALLAYRPSSVHQMQTRSKSGIFKTKHSPDFVSLTSHALHAALFSLVQPKGIKSAAKQPQWMVAMHDEMEVLKQNYTWTLVPRPSASNIVGSKWGSLDPHFPNHVCKIYLSRADTSLFVFTKDSCIMYLLMYVDDLILTGNNESLLTSFTTRLNLEFAIKDLGDLSYFLGLEVSYTNDGLFLSQAKYATDVLTRATLMNSKPVSTPLAANEVFVTGGGSFSLNYSLFDLCGSFANTSPSRPDLFMRYLGVQGKQPMFSRSMLRIRISFAMANTPTEIIWITHFASRTSCITTGSIEPTRSMCDNKSALFMSQNPVSHKRAKHIDLDYHFVRELVTSVSLESRGRKCMTLNALPPAPEAGAEPNIVAHLNLHYLYDMIQELRSMFEKQAGVEKFDLIQSFHACKQEEGKSVADYVLKMKGYVEQLERLGLYAPTGYLSRLNSNGLTKICGI
ncbi:putative zinc finger, CCHC-type containing protein [Tanacetum coccineum]